MDEEKLKLIRELYNSCGVPLNANRVWRLSRANGFPDSIVRAQLEIVRYLAENGPQYSARLGIFIPQDQHYDNISTFLLAGPVGPTSLGVVQRTGHLNEINKERGEVYLRIVPQLI